MSTTAFCKNLDKGYYHQAAQWRDEENKGVQPLRFLAEDLKRHGFYPEEREIKAAEEEIVIRSQIQPHEIERSLKAKQHAYDMLVLEKLMQDASDGGVVTRGPTATSVQKAFTYSTVQTLFPFFFESQIIAGILATPVLDELIYATTAINSHTANHLETSETAGDVVMAETGEGTVPVQWTVRVTERQVQLREFAGQIRASYESIRLASLPEFALVLNRAGQRWQNDITDFGIETLIAGDGAGAGAATTSATTTNGTPVYADLIKARESFPMGYMPNTLVQPREVREKMLNFPVFTDPLAGVLYQTRGDYPRPLGLNPVRWDYTGKATSYATTKAIMLDNRIAMKMYTEGGLLAESDRIIEMRWVRQIMSQWLCFATGDRQAVRVLTGW